MTKRLVIVWGDKEFTLLEDQTRDFFQQILSFMADKEHRTLVLELTPVDEDEPWKGGDEEC